MPQDFQTEESPETGHLPGPPPAAEATASAPLTEDLALSQLNHRDLSPQVIEEIAKNAGLTKSRKVRLALAAHPQTPRRIALRLLRESYTFDLMQFALAPAAAADLRRVADELLLSRLPSITLGERISLARRSSERLAGALLLDKETPVWQAALENSHLTEAAVIKALQKSVVPALVEAVSHHSKWSFRVEVRMALLRNAHTPLARAIEFAHRLQPAQLRDILHNSRLPEKIKAYLRKEAKEKHS